MPPFTMSPLFEIRGQEENQITKLFYVFRIHLSQIIIKNNNKYVFTNNLRII